MNTEVNRRQFIKGGAGALAFAAMFDLEAEFADCPVLYSDI